MGYEKDTYDYEGRGFTQPITKELVKRELMKYFDDDNEYTFDQLNNPDTLACIEDTINQIMFVLHQDLIYFKENYEDHIDKIIETIPV